MPGKKVNAHLEQLLSILDKQAELTTQETMTRLCVSESTARRLLTKLAERSDITRTFGGVCRTAASGAEYSYEQLEQEGTEAKQKIAAGAAGIVESGDVLYIDGGTTNAFFAMALAERIRGGGLCDIVVFTNSLATLGALAHVCDVHAVGGRYRENRRDFCGNMAENAVAGLRFTKCFLGADACEIDRGFTTTDFDTARLCGMVQKNSGESYILADDEKFCRTSLLPYAKLDSVTAVLTNDALKKQTRETFEQAGVRFCIFS